MKVNQFEIDPGRDPNVADWQRKQAQAVRREAEQAEERANILISVLRALKARQEANEDGL
jgi:hypothetical protein